MLPIDNVLLAIQNATSNVDVSTSDFYTFAGIGTIIGGIATAGALIYTIFQDKKTRLLEFVKDVDTEIAEHLKNDGDLKTRDACIGHAYIYLEILDRIAFLLEKKKIPKLFSDYYKNFFNYGITMMLWYVYAWKDEHTLEENWPSLIKWFENNGKKQDDEKGLNPYPLEHLPTTAYKIIEILEDEDGINEIKKIIANIGETGRIEQELIQKLNEESLKEVCKEKEKILEERLEREEIRKKILKERWRDEENKSISKEKHHQNKQESN